MDSFSEILNALSSIRSPLSTNEYDLHNSVKSALATAGIHFKYEVLIAPGCRIDFLAKHIGIEVKRSRPNLSQLLGQATRYLSSPMVDGLLVLCERDPGLPEILLGKPCRVLSLQRLWGIALVTGKASNTTAFASQCINNDIGVLETLFSSETKSPIEINENTTSTQLENIPQVTLPSYLQESPVIQRRVFGTLSYHSRNNKWVIRGDPAVTSVAKRLFPGSQSDKRGFVRFTAHRRFIGDLNWFMQRYPLAILPQDKERWQKALRDAQQHYLQLENFHVNPPSFNDCTGVFKGKLLPFQEYGASWLIQTKRGLLADEMGLGKTVQTLAALAATKSFPSIIVAPPHLISNWRYEINRFLSFDGQPPSIHILSGLKPYPLPQADLYLVHYLLLRGWKEMLPTFRFKSVVFDEIQELRHRGTEKYSAASLLADSCERVFGLSGTPIYNHGGEIWNVVNILDYHLLGDWESFTREWCFGYGNQVVSHPDWLGDHLRREGLMIRRTKKDVLPELPEKRRLVQQIDTDDALFIQLMKPVLEQLKTFSQNNILLSPSQRALLEGNLSQSERQATGIAKAPYVTQFVRALLENDEKVLLFAHHHKVMDILKQDLKQHSPAFITGRETTQQKEFALYRFMEGKTNLCCISLRAAAGLNLQRATCVVFAELDWSPAVHSQAEDRAHRIGQSDSLLCYYLVSSGGSDSMLQDVLGLKVSQFLGLMGESPENEKDAAQSANLARLHVQNMIERWLKPKQTGFD